MSEVPASLRAEVVLRAGNRCEYCQLSQLGQEAAFHIDHVIPRAAGGPTVLGNLALAGVDDNDRPWHEAVTGRSPEAWLLKQLYVERKFGRRPRQGKGRKKAAR